MGPVFSPAGDGEGGFLHDLNELKPLRRALALSPTDVSHSRLSDFKLGVENQLPV